MGKLVEFTRQEKVKPSEGLWQQDYLLFVSYSGIHSEDLPPLIKMPSGAEITLHPGNEARLLLNDQLLRLLALSPRELREAIFVTAHKIIRFRCSYKRPNNYLPFINFLKIVTRYVGLLESVVIDNNSMRCWYPDSWLKTMGGGNFEVGNYLTTHSTPEKEGKYYWMHTHGMGQFGCPELEVRMVSEQGIGPTIMLLSKLAGYMIKNGPVFKEGCRLAIVKGLCWITFKYCRESMEESHYRNNYYRIFVSLNNKS